MPQVTKSQIIYNETDFLSGLHPKYGSETIPQKFGKFSRQQLAFNPYDDLGYAKNGFLNTDFENESSVTSVITKVIRAGTYYYGINAKDYLYRLENIGGSNSSVTTGSPFPYQVNPHSGHTGVILSDIIAYYNTNNKVYSIFYSWNDNTDGDVGIHNIVSGTSDSDFMSTRPANAQALISSYPHPLCVGHDDLLYIGNGRSLYYYDYSNTSDSDGALFTDVLLLPEGYVIKSIIKLQPRSLIIFANKISSGISSEPKAFFWDYLSSDPYQIEDLHDFEVKIAFEYKGTIACITEGYGEYKKIKVFNGTEFETLTKFGLVYQSEAGPSIGGVDVNNNEIYIHTSNQVNGYIYKYGNNDGLKNVIDIVQKSQAGVSGYQSGFIKLTANNGISFSTGKTDDTSATIQYLDKTKYATEGLWYSDLLDIGHERIQITGITVYFADEFTGGRTISLSLTDRYNTYAIAGLTSLATVTATNRIYRVKPLLNGTTNTQIPPLDGIGLNLTWGAGSGSSKTPIINKVVLDYKPSVIN